MPSTVRLVTLKGSCQRQFDFALRQRSEPTLRATSRHYAAYPARGVDGNAGRTVLRTVRLTRMRRASIPVENTCPRVGRRKNEWYDTASERYASGFFEAVEFR